MIRYKIKSNLDENQIEADVANYMGWISPEGALPFRLISVNEQLTGADKRFDLAIPLYLQFKVSQGLKPIHLLDVPGVTMLRKLQMIRHYRRRNNLFDNPTLYFKLRDKAKEAEDFQHNVLLQFANSGKSHAFYVAPLTTDKDEYAQQLFDTSSRYLDTPFSFRRIEIHQTDWVSYLGFVPFLRAHVSIVPHEVVSTSDHYYSYSTSGSDLAWHSPQSLNYSTRLSDRLVNIFRRSIYDKEMWMSFEQLAAYVRGLEIRGIEMYNSDLPPIETIMEFEKRLYDMYQIKQVIAVTRLEILDRIRQEQESPRL